MACGIPDRQFPQSRAHHGREPGILNRIIALGECALKAATQLLLIAIVTPGVVSGCVSLPRGPGFRQVQDAVRERSGLTVHWDQEKPAAASPEPEEIVHALLQKELTADDAVEVALLNNRRLQALFEELEITRAGLVQVALPRNPVIGGEVRFSDTFSNPFEIMLTQSLLDLVQIGVRRRLAAAAYEPAKLRTADEVLRLVAEIRTAFHDVQAAGQVQAMRRTIVEAGRAAAELATRQHQAGNISDLDLENEQALLEQAELDLSTSTGDVLVGRERLNVLMGLSGAQTGWRIAPALPDLPATEPELDDLETRTVSRRLDLMAARQDIEAAARARPLARLEGIADLGIGVHREREPDGTMTTGPALEIPVPIFPRGRAARDRALATLRQSQQRYAALAVEARAAAREARERMLLARRRVEYYRDVVLPRRQRIVDQSVRHYNFMLLGTFHLLQARQNEINARLEHIESLRDYWVARTELERVSGGRPAAGGPGDTPDGGDTP